jgi:hypothetical protein
MFEEKPNLNWSDRRRVIRLGFWGGVGFWLATLVVLVLASLIVPGAAGFFNAF